ncbi:MAG: hypothetical protein ACPIA2_00665 [Mariniblastus sp.]
MGIFTSEISQLLSIVGAGSWTLSSGVLGQGMISLFVESFKLFLILLAPFVAFTVLIHWFEYLTQRRMSERLGWKSVLWTGWLGTPVHELSHVFMCRVFGHRIDDVALFEPDRDSGRLGYVRHSFEAGNWFQEMGNLFIGIAPLMGGSAVLAILLWLFYPEAASNAAESARLNSADSSLLQVRDSVVAVVTNIVTISNVATVRFWTFIYLVLCVGSHMAPSRCDYQGASRGVIWVGGILLISVFLLACAGVNGQQMINGMIGIMGPLFAVLGLAILLCGLTTTVVFSLTAFMPVRLDSSDEN